MNYLMLFIGLFLVALGFLVRRYPILISGYNTMSAKEKENVDIKGLSAFMCRCLVVMGVTLSGSYYFCVWMQWWAIVAYVPVFVPLIFVVYALVKAQKYDHNRKNNNQKTKGNIERKPRKRRFILKIRRKENNQESDERTVGGGEL